MAFKSLAARLIFWTLLASGAVLAATLYASNRLARETAVAAAELEARQAADRLANRVRAVLVAVEESAQLLGAALETTEPEPAAVERLLRRYVGTEEDVSAAGAAYLPGQLAGRALFAPYVYRILETPGQLRVVDLGAAGGYTHLEWYRNAASSREPSWSEPYLDSISRRAMVTYAVPFFADEPEAGPSRRLRGVASADVRLDFLSQVVAEVHPGQTGRALVLSRRGRILALSDGAAVEREVPLLEQLSPARRTALEPLVRHMMSRTPGFESIVVNGEQGRVVYQRIGMAGWSLGVFYPERELMAGVTRLRLLQATLGVLGLVVLAAVVVTLSRRLTAPLRELAAEARDLATNLDRESPLPAASSRDELGALARAFAEMRSALRRYVRDLELTTAAKQRLESELAIASRIQGDMLPAPRAGSVEDGYELAALLAPAREVGGDLFHHRAAEGHVFFLVADVSGKGVPAALFMARAKTLFDAAAERFRDPAQLLAEVNRGLCRENEAGMYVTAACGVLALATGELCFACAGHEPPIRLSPGQRPQPLATEGGTVLGLRDGVSFRRDSVRLQPGEAVFAFTDGVAEAFDGEGQLFGSSRLMECLDALAAQPVEQVNASVRQAVAAFAGPARQSDDITMLTLRYLGPPPAGGRP